MLRNRTTYKNVLNYHDYRWIRPFFIFTAKDIISCSYCDIHYSMNSIPFLKFTIIIIIIIMIIIIIIRRRRIINL